MGTEGQREDDGNVLPYDLHAQQVRNREGGKEGGKVDGSLVLLR